MRVKLQEYWQLPEKKPHSFEEWKKMKAQTRFQVKQNAANKAKHDLVAEEEKRKHCREEKRSSKGKRCRKSRAGTLKLSQSSTASGFPCTRISGILSTNEPFRLR